MPDDDNATLRRAGRPSPAGLTVLELMVVMTIIAGVMGAAISSLGFITQGDLRNAAMRMTSAIQYTWGRAAMNNAQYRLVIDLDNNSYHTEVTGASVVERENVDLEEQNGEEDSEEDSDDSSFDEDDRNPFNLNRKPSYKEVKDSALESHKLPEGIEIHSVVTANRPEPIKKGKAAVRFFPNGFQEPAIIVLTSGPKSFFSLKTEALTGRVKIYPEKLKKSEAFGKPDEVQEEW